MRYELRRVSETDEAALRAAYDLLDADRRAKIRALRREQAQRQCLCAESLVRELLSRESGLAPSALKFARGSHGKPFLTNAPVQFNLSHSGDFVLCAVDDRPVGADIEFFRPISPALIDRVCSAEEKAFVGGDSRRFLQVWTVKEAVVKHSGLGLHGDLRKISARVPPDLTLLSEGTEDYVLSIVTERK